MSKFDKLESYLRSLTVDEKDFTFAELEEIIGNKLTESAYKHAAYWSADKNGTHTLAHAILRAGFKVTPKINEQKVVLHRVSESSTNSNFRVIDLNQIPLGKGESSMNRKVYVVFQKSGSDGQFNTESSGGYIQAPNTGKNGKPLPWHWATMLEIKNDDIVFHLSDQKIAAVSFVKKEHYVPTGDTSQNRVDCEYTILNNYINLVPFRTELANKCKGLQHAPFNVKGGGNQIYLGELPKSLYYLFASEVLNNNKEQEQDLEYLKEMLEVSADTSDEDTGGTVMAKGNLKMGLNTILYGPPGTGKTYNSKIYAVAICDCKTIDEVKAMDYKTQVLPRYNKLVSEGRIAFTTFHQSYGYEDFIEGIQPQTDDNSGVKNVYYEIEPGTFKSFCEKAPTFFDSPSGSTALSGIDFDKKWSEFVNDVNGGGMKFSLIRPNSKNKDKELYVRSKVNVVIPQGSGLPLTKANALKFFKGEKVEHDSVELLKDLYIYFAYIYLGMTSPKIEENDKSEVVLKPCVFIIDEINRGNISKIFGELITLIEESKRQGESEEMSCILPYSQEVFSVPNNVYILGTMNTADRSIALMDTALRRRFEFIEMMPESDILRKLGADKVTHNSQTLDVANMLEVINKRIEVLYDREHTIGHAFFTGLTGSKATLENLGEIFENKVIPLLQEYFYEDYEKIRLVLGDNAKSSEDYQFVLETTNKAKDIFKGNVDDNDIPEHRYSINKKAFSLIESYLEII